MNSNPIAFPTPQSLLPPGPPSLAERVGGLCYKFFQALPLFASPDRPFLNPGPDAAHTAEAIAIPLEDGHIPGYWLAPKAGTGAAVLLVHGATTVALAPYMFFMRALIERGIAVMTVELDGHGSNPRAFDPAVIEDNVPAALGALFARPGVDPTRVGVLGVSLGGACALHAAAQRDDVKALATVGLPLTLSIDWRTHLAEGLGILSPHCVPIIFTMAPRRIFTFLIEPMRVASAQGVFRSHIMDPETPRVIDAALKRLAPMRHLEKLAGVPLLVLNGSWDTVAPPRHARELHAAAHGPAELAISPMRNHFTIMTCPRAARRLGEWFERHLTVAAPIHEELAR